MQEMVQHRLQAENSGRLVDGRHSSTCTQVVWIFFWLLILVLFAYPIAIIAALLYALLSPLSLIKCSRPFTDLLLGALNLPLTCARNVAEARQLFVM